MFRQCILVSSSTPSTSLLNVEATSDSTTDATRQLSPNLVTLHVSVNFNSDQLQWPGIINDMDCGLGIVQRLGPWPPAGVRCRL